MTPAWWRGKRQRYREEEFAEELENYLAHEAEENLARGMTPADARAAALRKFGNRTHIKEKIYEMKANRFLEDLTKDVRYSLRTLHKDRSFTLLAVLLLALGIGLAAGVFHLVYAVLIQPLAVVDSDRLVMLSSVYGSSPRTTTTLDDYWDIRKRAGAFEGLAAYTSLIRALNSGDSRPEMVWTSYVSSNLFSIMKAKPYRGQVFSNEDDHAGGASHIILSFGLWQRRFGGDPSLIGRLVTLDREKSATVIGVMPPDFKFPLEGMLPEGKSADVWSPFNEYPVQWLGRKDHHLSLLGRLRSGVSLDAAQAQLDTISGQLAKQFPSTNRSERLFLSALQDEILAGYREPLVLFLTAVGLVFLIACFNVAGLFLARATSRIHEVTIRSALGASNFRLVRQFLTEALIVAAAAGAIGVVISVCLARVLPWLGASSLPRSSSGGFILPILLFSAAISTFAGLFCGLIPFVSLFRNTIHEGLRGTARTMTQDRQRQRTGALLVISQVALAFLLSTGSILLIRSFNSLVRIPPGFHPEHTVSVSLPVALYPDIAQRLKFSEQTLLKAREIPGVQAVGMVDRLPLDGFDNKSLFYVEGTPTPASSAELAVARVRSMMPGYFEAIGMTMQSGRKFTDHDSASSIPVIVVNQSAANLFWPGRNPLSGRLKEGLPADANSWLTVVGVVNDIRQDGLASAPVPEIFFPARQRSFFFQSLVVRSVRDPESTIAAIRDTVYSIDKEMPVTFIRRLDTFAAESTAPSRLRALLTSIFAALALLMSAAGVYGLTAYTVSQRVREMGIRVALGADPNKLVRAIVSRAMNMVWAGLVLGLMATPVFARFLSGFVYGVSPIDPVAISESLLVLLISALLASYLPARRAMKVDPASVLRQE
jgi:predicted permease